MLNLKVIGAGAAGNKAAIELINAGFDKSKVVLMNSTQKDIPDEYKNFSMIFGASANSLGGCGKEREVGKRLILQDLKSGTISLDGIADPTTHAVVIVSSTEGGSGSAVTPILAKYIRNVLNIPVILCLFFGFNTDVRGMQNSIEICQELADNYGVIGISNAKFLSDAFDNRLEAEKLANKEFVRIVRTLTGTDIHPGTQNIDDTDLYKLVTTPGYMHIGSADIKNVKNIDQYNKAINGAIDNSKLLDTPEKGAKRIGVIYNADDNDTGIDYNATAIQTRYGTPYEYFMHIQSSNKPSATWIVAGLPLPLKEVKAIYDNYIQASNSVKKTADSFFDEISGLQGHSEDGLFNMLSGTPKNNNTKAAKAGFFEDFGIK